MGFPSLVSVNLPFFNGVRSALLENSLNSVSIYSPTKWPNFLALLFQSKSILLNFSDSGPVPPPAP